MKRRLWLQTKPLMPYVLVGVVLGLAANAAASNFGSEEVLEGDITGGVYLIPLENNPQSTYRRHFRVAMRGMNNEWQDAVKYAMNAVYNLTFPEWMLVTVASSSTCTDSEHSACTYAEDYDDNGAAGWNACIGTTAGEHPNKTCTLNRVRFNTHYTVVPKKTLACHEIGHAWGLRHTWDGESCMSYGNSTILTDHDYDHLNQQYWP